MKNPFESSEEELHEASRAIVVREAELAKDAREDPTSIANLVWENRAFHGASILYRRIEVNIPKGPEAQIFLGIVIAALEQAGVTFNMGKEVTPDLDFPNLPREDLLFLLSQDPDSEPTIEA